MVRLLASFRHETSSNMEELKGFSLFMCRLLIMRFELFNVLYVKGANSTEQDSDITVHDVSSSPHRHLHFQRSFRSYDYFMCVDEASACRVAGHWFSFMALQEDRPGQPEYPEIDGDVPDLLNPPIVFYIQPSWPFAPGCALRLLQ